MKSFLVSARVTFLSEADGGRRHPAINDRRYRPSIVFGDVSQRQAIFGDDGRTLVEPYRMTAFAGDGKELLADIPYVTEMVVTYYPGLSGYEAPESGDTFTIREGSKIVGFGEILEIPRNLE